MLGKFGNAGHIAGYDVLVLADAVVVSDAHGTRIGAPAARPGFRIRRGRFPDWADVLHLYDIHDGGCFGYAVNLSMPDCSEWGYAPFAAGGTEG